MFSRSGNEERPVGILSDVWVCRKSKLPAINRKYIGNNVDIRSRIDFKLGLLVYECLHGNAPPYLVEML